MYHHKDYFGAMLLKIIELLIFLIFKLSISHSDIKNYNKIQHIRGPHKINIYIYFFLYLK